MKFSIITPSYNMLNYLKLCSSSVCDQEGVDFEHIIIDGNSEDGTKSWIQENSNSKSISEPDKGMYNAINKGFALAEGDIISYLNCDEQYLPDTLKKVRDYFDDNPNIDIVFGHALITNPSGELLSFRKAYRPSYNYIITSILYNLSCTMFLRRNIIDNGFKFDEKFKDVGDADFVLRLLKNGFKASYINDYLSVFMWTGKNMSQGENAVREKKILRNSASNLIISLRYIINIFRLIEKFFSKAYFQRFPLLYRIYIHDFDKRKDFNSSNASFRWPD